MKLGFGITLHTMRLYNGYHSLYATLTFIQWTGWLQRWDLKRDKKHFIVERNKIMSWSWGRLA